MFDVRDIQLLQESLARYDFLINSPFIEELNQYNILVPQGISSSIRLLLVKSLSASETISTFEFILNALNSLNQTIGYILDFTSDPHSIYIGIKGNCSYALSVLSEGLMASFPDSIIEEVSDPVSVLTKLLNFNLYKQLSSATVIPNSTNGTSLLTSFTSLMGTSNFACFFLAKPVPSCEVKMYYEELCELYYILSHFSQANMSHLTGISKNSSMTVLTGDTITHGNSHTDTSGCSNSKGGADYSNITLNTACPFSILHHTKNINASVSYLANNAHSHNYTTNRSEAKGNTYSHANLNNTSKLSAENLIDNNSINFSAQNRCVQNALAVLGNMIDYIRLLSQTSCFQYGAYFFSAFPATATRAAYSFLGLAQNANTYLGPSAVNLFNSDHPNYKELYASLFQFEHPAFSSPQFSEQILTSTTSIQSAELLNSIYLPIS